GQPLDAAGLPEQVADALVEKERLLVLRTRALPVPAREGYVAERLGRRGLERGIVRRASGAARRLEQRRRSERADADELREGARGADRGARVRGSEPLEKRRLEVRRLRDEMRSGVGALPAAHARPVLARQPGVVLGRPPDGLRRRRVPAVDVLPD